jgi:murein DD-endopeptidase MepM/ murein hydrolase activator NlpD
MLVRPYIAPPTPYAAGHRGIDIGATGGAQVLAPDDGVVHFAGVVVDRPVLSIRHSGGMLSSFEPVSSVLEAGDRVHRGDVVGVLQPGHCSEPCLHFGVRLHGEYLSPLNYLGGIPHSVLLPTRPLR